jgi:hypothetical protein
VILVQKHLHWTVWEMNAARWSGGVLQMVGLEPGIYEVAVKMVGDNFYMSPYRFCVGLSETGEITVWRPRTHLSRLWRRVTRPLRRASVESE